MQKTFVDNVLKVFLKRIHLFRLICPLNAYKKKKQVFFSVWFFFLGIRGGGGGGLLGGT